MMYNGYVIKTEEKNAEHILKCLAVFEIWQTSQKINIYGDNPDDWNMFIGYSFEVEKEQAYEMKAEGEKYYNSGYRIKRTERHMSGIPMNVPENAIAWVAVSADYIATAEAFRIEYLVRTP